MGRNRRIVSCFSIPSQSLSAPVRIGREECELRGRRNKLSPTSSVSSPSSSVPPSHPPPHPYPYRSPTSKSPQALSSPVETEDVHGRHAPSASAAGGDVGDDDTSRGGEVGCGCGVIAARGRSGTHEAGLAGSRGVRVASLPLAFNFLGSD